MNGHGVLLHDDWLRVFFPNGGHGDFHFRWLRHNCSRDLHPKTRERTLCSSEISDSLRVGSASVVDDTLVVRWRPEERESHYPLRWLEENAYARDREALRIPNDSAAISIGARGMTHAACADRALGCLRAHGAVVVRRDPTASTSPEHETESLIDAFQAMGLSVIPTHFGRIEDLRADNVTNANNDQLGYTDSAIDLHTDQPFLEKPPRFQMLQCIRPAHVGGDSYLVDAFSAARHLRSVDDLAYELLSETPIRFHRKQKDFEKVLEASILAGGADDVASFQVRYSYFTLAAYRFSFGRMEAWYRAHDRFARIVRDARNQYRFSLGPGDFVLYDNYRMLHARTSFRGARWFRGVYFDRR